MRKDAQVSARPSAVFPVREPAQGDGKAQFAALVAAFVADQQQFEPVSADQVGVTTYNDRLADRTPAGHAAEIAAMRAWRVRFAAAPAAPDDRDTAVDRRTAIDTIDQTLIEDETLAGWQNDPVGYVGELGAAFFLPFVRAGESADARFGLAAGG